MKLTTSPTPEDLTHLAQDILFEIRTGLVSGVKISKSDQIVVVKISTNQETGHTGVFVHLWDRKSNTDDDIDLLQFGYDNAIEILRQNLKETGGKFTRFQ